MKALDVTGREGHFDPLENFSSEIAFIANEKPALIHFRRVEMIPVRNWIKMDFFKNFEVDQSDI